ncbi:MAG: DJ-1 family glyoxalase III [Kiritimatiellia bacterium]|nr:DJ-1/PfpI family protein [Lentisphaerota bacterium]
MPTVLIPLAAGVEEMEAVIMADVLRRGGLEVTLAGLAGAGAVTGSRQVRLLPDTAWHKLDPLRFDALALPGGMGGTEALAADTSVLEAVRRMSAADKWLAAVCAAPLVLQAAGVLAGRRVTSYPGLAERMPEARWVDRRVVVDGRLVTGQGPGVAMIFSLTLVSLMVDRARAQATARAMLCEQDF